MNTPREGPYEAGGLLSVVAVLVKLVEELWPNRGFAMPDCQCHACRQDRHVIQVLKAARALLSVDLPAIEGGI